MQRPRRLTRKRITVLGLALLLTTLPLPQIYLGFGVIGPPLLTLLLIRSVFAVFYIALYGTLLSLPVILLAGCLARLRPMVQRRVLWALAVAVLLGGFVPLYGFGGPGGGRDDLNLYQLCRSFLGI